MVGGQVGGDLTTGVVSNPKLFADPGVMRLIYLNASRMPPPFFSSQGDLESYFRYHFEHQMALRTGCF